MCSKLKCFFAFPRIVLRYPVCRFVIIAITRAVAYSFLFKDFDSSEPYSRTPLIRDKSNYRQTHLIITLSFLFGGYQRS